MANLPELTVRGALQDVVPFMFDAMIVYSPESEHSVFLIRSLCFPPSASSVALWVEVSGALSFSQATVASGLAQISHSNATSTPSKND